MDNDDQLPILVPSCMQSNKAAEVAAERTIFYAEDRTVPFWDHPNFIARAVIPDSYQPLTRVEQVIEMWNRRVFDDDAIRILKVLGDAQCANEAQLKNYLRLYEVKYSTTYVSNTLRKFAKYGMVERYDCRIGFLENDGDDYPKRPAPFTLGIAGVKFLQHYYSYMTFVKTDVWRQSNATIQRYVAMNEIRYRIAKAKVLTAWKWMPFIGGHTKYQPPIAVATIKEPTSQVEIQLIFDRAQSSQYYVKHLQQRLQLYHHLFQKDGYVHVDAMKNIPSQLFLISCGTLAMAKQLNIQLELHKYPFKVWFVLDEWLEGEYGLVGAFARSIQTAEGFDLERFQFKIFE